MVAGDIQLCFTWEGPSFFGEEGKDGYTRVDRVQFRCHERFLDIALPQPGDLRNRVFTVFLCHESDCTRLHSSFSFSSEKFQHFISNAVMDFAVLYTKIEEDRRILEMKPRISYGYDMSFMLSKTYTERSAEILPFPEIKPRGRYEFVGSLNPEGKVQMTLREFVL